MESKDSSLETFPQIILWRCKKVSRKALLNFNRIYFANYKIENNT
jgi:hypothetical protein